MSVFIVGRFDENRNSPWLRSDIFLSSNRAFNLFCVAHQQDRARVEDNFPGLAPVCALFYHREGEQGAFYQRGFRGWCSVWGGEWRGGGGA